MYVSTQRRQIILWWSNLETLFAPPPPQLALHRRAALCQAIQMEHGPHIAERIQKAVSIL
jgi:hypothetical protein